MIKQKKRFRYTIKKTRDRRIARFGKFCFVFAVIVLLLPFVALFRIGEIWWVYKVADFRPHMVLACIGVSVFFLILGRIRYASMLFAVAAINIIIMSASLIWPILETDESAGLTVAFFNNADNHDLEASANEADIIFAANLDEKSNVFPFTYEESNISVLTRQRPLAIGKIDGHPWVQTMLSDEQKILIVAVDFKGIYNDIDKTEKRLEKLAAFCASSAVPVAVIGNWQAAWWNPLFYKFSSRSSLKSDAFYFPNFPAKLPRPIRLSYGYAAYHQQLKVVSSGTLDAVDKEDYLPIYYKFSAVEK